MQLGLGVPPATVPCQQGLEPPGILHHCWPGLVLPRPSNSTWPWCQELPVLWGSASPSPEPSSAVVPPGPQLQGMATSSQPCAQHGCSLCWVVLLDATPDCSTYIHWLLIALKIFKD